MEHASDTPQIRVHLTAESLIACEVRRNWRGTRVIRKESFNFVPGERAAAMDTLAGWIGKGSGRSSIMWIIGPAEAIGALPS